MSRLSKNKKKIEKFSNDDFWGPGGFWGNENVDQEEEEGGSFPVWAIILIIVFVLIIIGVVVMLILKHNKVKWSRSLSGHTNKIATKYSTPQKK